MNLQTKNSHVSPAVAASELLTRRKARNGLLPFTLYTKPDYEVNWHHQILADALDGFVEGVVKRLMICLPPRHGKSELVSRRLPAYIFGRNPDARIGAVSYSADLASRMNRDVQSIIDTPEYTRLFPDTKLFGKSVRDGIDGSYLRNSDIFEIVGFTGYYRSAGVGGGITGMGFDYIIIDDPIKNRAEANSPTIRQTHWDWYTSTLYTRLEKNGSILLTLTRWHFDDLAGRLLALEQESGVADQWTVITLPAIAREPLNEYDQREIGQPLWESKFGNTALERIQANNAFEFEALYQQSPKVAGNALFDTAKIEIVDNAPECIKVVRFYDLAVRANKRADYTAGVKLGVTQDEQFVILDVWRGQKELPDVHEIIAQNAHIDGVKVPIRLEAEKAGIIQLDYLLRDSRLRSFILDAKPPLGDKYTRASPFATRVNAGRVKMVRGTWNRAYLDELAIFPQGANDDQVDATSGAYDMLANEGKIEVIEGWGLYDYRG